MKKMLLGMGFLLFLSACGAEVAITAGAGAENQKKEMEEAQKVKKQVTDDLAEQVEIMNQQRQELEDQDNDTNEGEDSEGN